MWFRSMVDSAVDSANSAATCTSRRSKKRGPQWRRPVARLRLEGLEKRRAGEKERTTISRRAVALVKLRSGFHAFFVTGWAEAESQWSRMREALEETGIAIIALVVVAVPYLCWRLSGAQSTYELQNAVVEPPYWTVVSDPPEKQGSSTASAR